MPARTTILVTIAAIFMPLAGFSQELVPRAYWPAPSGTNLFVTGYQYSEGDVLTDPSLPIDGVESKVEFLSLTYQRTFALFDRTTNLQLNVPYAWGSAQGFAEGEFRSRDISSLTDTRARLMINLAGAPAMDVAEFQTLRKNPRTIVGASLLVSAPTGGYDPDKLFNAGSNRWAIKPAIGIIYPLRPKLLLEFEVGYWLYGDNDEFLGATRSQDPVFSTEFHVIKRIRPGFWAALDLNYYAGGSTDVGGVSRNDRQENSRIGATVLVPFKRQHAIRVAASVPLSTKIGGDFDTLTVAYAYVWR